MRQASIVIIALLLIVGSYFGAKQIIANKDQRRPKAEKPLAIAYFKTVQNDDISIKLIESGRLVAKRKMNLYAEVQGVMEPIRKDFKPGARFKKGETLLKIRNDDFYANLQAQKSVLQNLVTSILPDLRLDFPESFNNWDDYLRNFDINSTIAPLPKPLSEKEKFFITGKNIYTTYYNTKNLEITHEKYTLRAPFTGILTESEVNPGTVIRPGQRIGEFIDPSIYEMEISINQSLITSVEIGSAVEVYPLDNRTKTWAGTITRVNGKVDPNTQTVDVYVELAGKSLKEGMFLQAELPGTHQPNAYELDRKLLINEKEVYTIADSILQLTPVRLIHKNQSTVIVGGLNNGAKLLSRVIPGAYAGMKVSMQPNSAP